jgi:hypothetical protein
MVKRVLAVAAVMAAMLAVSTGSASAKSSTVVATPSMACKTLVKFGATDMSFGGCMGTLHGNVAAFRFPSDTDPNVLLSLSQRCAGFEAEGLTYPFAFEEGPGWPFPVFTAHNRNQCEVTLYTYHTLADALFGG